MDPFGDPIKLESLASESSQLRRERSRSTSSTPPYHRSDLLGSALVGTGGGVRQCEPWASEEMRVGPGEGDEQSRQLGANHLTH